MQRLRLFVASVFTATVAMVNMATAETNWPRFAGVYLQLYGGELVQLPSLREHPSRNYMAFSRSVLDDLPRVQIDEIEALILYNVDYLTEDGKLDIQWTYLVDRHLDPENSFAQKSGTDLAVGLWGWQGNKFNIEYGPKHQWTNYQLALYPKEGGGHFLSNRTGTAKGDDPWEIPVEANFIRGSCCTAGWAFVPVVME